LSGREAVRKGGEYHQDPHDQKRKKERERMWWLYDFHI